MRPSEANEKAAQFVADALLEAELSEGLTEKGQEQESERQAARAQFHASLATALMLTHGIVYTSSQGD